MSPELLAKLPSAPVIELLLLLERLTLPFDPFLACMLAFSKCPELPLPQELRLWLRLPPPMSGE
jgi:hypothetical protein